MHMGECIPQMTWRVTYMFRCCQIRPTHSRVPELRQWCSRQELRYVMPMKLTAADLALATGAFLSSLKISILPSVCGCAGVGLCTCIL